MKKEREMTKSKIGKGDALLVDFFVAISSLDDDYEAQLFLSDLLSKEEVKRLARRLRIAILLSNGYSYSTIRKGLGVANDTIANVNRWLEQKGKGYEIAIGNLRDLGLVSSPKGEKSRESSAYSPQISKKARHSKYAECFWPVELVSAINDSLKSANEKQNKR